MARAWQPGVRNIVAGLQALDGVRRVGFFDPEGILPADLQYEEPPSNVRTWLEDGRQGRELRSPGYLVVPIGAQPRTLLLVQGADCVEKHRPVVEPLAHALDRLLPERRGGLEDSLILHQLVQDYPFGAVVIYDTDFRYIEAGGVDLEAVGLERERMIGRTAQEVFPEVFDQIAAPYRQALAGEATQLDVPYLDQWYATNNGPIRNAEGDIVGGMTVTSRVTEAKRTTMALQASQRLLEESQNVGGVGSWSVQIDTHEIMWSQTGADVHGFPPARAPTTVNALLSTLTSQSASLLQRELSSAIEQEDERGAQEVEVQDAKDRWLRIRMRRSEGEDGPQVVALSLDITKQRRLQTELEQAKERAEAGERARADFLAVMSHEMRTPLHGIIASATLLEDHELGPDEAELLRTIASSSEALLNIINDVLDLTKLEHGKIELESLPFSVHDLVETATDIVRPRLEGTRVDLGISIAPDVIDRRCGDAGRLRQVLLNLLGNACKFTSEGRIDLFVTQEPGLRFEVRDTGIGIDSARLHHLFEPFSQADSSTQRRYGGTGLGLAIVTRISDAMEGSVWAESVPGQGSSFFFETTVPVDDAPPASELPSVADRREPKAAGRADRPRTSESGAIQADRCSRSSGGTPLRVLVVDDNPVNRRVAQRLMERLGHQVRLAREGSEALDILRDHRFDLVLMDLQMPNLDGFETMRRARANGQERTPIWAFTANALAQERERCLAAGFDDYLTKPLRLRDLEQALFTVSRDDEPRQ